MIKDRNGNMITNDEDILKRWEEFFGTLLNRPEPTNPLEKGQYHGCEPHVEEPSLEEVRAPISALKRNKASGVDQIPAELLKHGGAALEEGMHRLVREIWSQERMPSEWEVGIIVPIFKKGDKADCENYRGISLLCTGYKVLTRILYTRLLPHADLVLGENQCGFRHGRGTLPIHPPTTYGKELGIQPSTASFIRRLQASL